MPVGQGCNFSACPISSLLERLRKPSLRSINRILTEPASKYLGTFPQSKKSARLPCSDPSATRDNPNIQKISNMPRTIREEPALKADPTLLTLEPSVTNS